MLRAMTISLLMTAVPIVGHAAVGTAAIDDTMAMLRAAPAAASSSVHDCEASNVLRRLSGCSELIRSGDARGSALARAHRNRGMALFSLGEKRRAIEDFDLAIRHAPEDPALYLARGTAWQHLGEHEMAIEDLVKVIEYDPRSAAAYGNLGVAWEKLGDDARALENYNRSLTLDGENAIVLNNRGNVLARLGERRRAIADYDRALRLDPEYASAYYNRAGERCLEGNAEPAVADYLHAVRLGDRQRRALEDFLSRQGYLDGEQAAGEGAANPDLEPALRRWSAGACIAPSATTRELQTRRAPEAGAAARETRRSTDALPEGAG